MDLRRLIIISGLCCCLKQSFTFTVTQIIDGHTAMIADINDLKDSVVAIEETSQIDMGYVGIGVGVIGIAIAVVALVRSRN